MLYHTVIGVSGELTTHEDGDYKPYWCIYGRTGIPQMPCIMRLKLKFDSLEDFTEVTCCGEHDKVVINSLRYRDTRLFGIPVLPSADNFCN